MHTLPSGNSRRDNESFIQLLAALDGLTASLEVLRATRSAAAALESLAESRRQTMADPETAVLARQAANILPAPIIDEISRRVERCETNYVEALRRLPVGDIVPYEDDLEMKLTTCMCRELGRFPRLGIAIPRKRWQRYWQTFCQPEPPHTP